MYGRLIPGVLTLALAIGAVIPVTPVNAREFDDRALARNIRELMETNDIARLFSLQEITALLEALEKPKVDSIDRILAAKAVIQVSINPETRVKASRTRVPLPKIICDQPSPWLIRVVNEGYLTAPLGVSVQGIPNDGDYRAVIVGGKLSGTTIEYRLLRVSMATRGLTDITFVFEGGPDTSDIGSRAELPLLLNCST